MAWIKVCDQLSSQSIVCLCEFNSRLYAGTTTGGRLFRLNLAGNAWEQVCGQLNGQVSIWGLGEFNGRLYGGTGSGGRLFRLNLAGDAWEQVCAQLNSQIHITSNLIVYNGRLYGGTYDSQLNDGGRLFRLNLTENAWEQVCAKIDSQTGIYSLCEFEGRLYAAGHRYSVAHDARLLRLNLAGDAWEEVCANFYGEKYLFSLCVFESRLYGSTGQASDDGRLLRLNLAQNAWEQVCTTYNSQISVYSICEFNGRLYGGTGNNGRLFRLNLAGNAWEEVCIQYGSENIIRDIRVFNGALYGAGYSGGRLLLYGVILTYTAGSNGTISGTSPQNIGYGNNGSEVTAVPNTGYAFSSWSDGVLAAARTDLNVTGDITVTANFTLLIYKERKIPMIRSEENNIDFSDKIYSPSFPVQHGVKYHSYITEKPLYTITTRTYGTTKIHWRSENVTKTDRDTLYDFWNTNISKGDTGVSVIDNRGRILFEANWDNWSETWEKKRGGVYNIDYNMESSVLWTPPCLGFFPMLTSPTVNYLQTGNIVLSNGVFCSYATDNRVLRKMGYALKVSDELSILQTGATVDLTPFNWSRESEYNNLTVFCQFKFAGHDAMHMSRIHLVSLEYGADCYFRLILEADDRVLGMLNNRGTIVRVRKSDLTYQTFDADIWYDAAFTFDAVTHKSYVYLCPSATTSFTDFLYGQTDITEQIGSYDGDTADPPDVKWDTLRLIEESTTAAIPPDGLVYLQNAMIFNGYLTAYDFNMLRRLCFLWNTNTTEMLPK